MRTLHWGHWDTQILQTYTCYECITHCKCNSQCKTSRRLQPLSMDLLHITSLHICILPFGVCQNISICFRWWASKPLDAFRGNSPTAVQSHRSDPENSQCLAPSYIPPAEAGVNGEANLSSPLDMQALRCITLWRRKAPPQEIWWTKFGI